MVNTKLRVENGQQDEWMSVHDGEGVAAELLRVEGELFEVNIRKEARVC
jgi:hypothetical protein